MEGRSEIWIDRSMSKVRDILAPIIQEIWDQAEHAGMEKALKSLEEKIKDEKPVLEYYQEHNIGRMDAADAAVISEKKTYDKVEDFIRQIRNGT